jgi:rhodanese-related sulfurtransferase
VFSYKTAVAVKNLGYRNIKIYNGGIKDWQKSGLALEAIHPLPDIDAAFIAADTLKQTIEDTQARGCIDSHGEPLVTILDFRNENFLNPDSHPPRILSTCQTQTLLLDDLRNPDVRSSIPRHGLIVTITETGNRDAYVMRYLSQFGFSNVKGLQFGMRSWIKLGYPTETSSTTD